MGMCCRCRGVETCDGFTGRQHASPFGILVFSPPFLLINIMVRGL